MQLRWVTFAGGANEPSLVEAQSNFATTGATAPSFVANVRPPSDVEPLDPGWKPIGARIGEFEDWSEADGTESEWPDDLEALYWWRDTFWRGAHP